MNRYKPTEIPLISTPTTSANRRNANNRPVCTLGRCTPSQLFASTGIGNGLIFLLGVIERSVGICNALTRQANRPFLFIGTSADEKGILLSNLRPHWTISSAQASLPAGSGALLYTITAGAHLELSEHLESWACERFIILHLGRGIQLRAELLNMLPSLGSCLIICESLNQCLFRSEISIAPKEVLSMMNLLIVFKAGVSTKTLVNDILPSYQYEKVANTMTVNSYRGRSVFHPFRRHKGGGISFSQTRSTEHQKPVLECDELDRIFSNGTALVYNAETNAVFLADITR